MRKPRDYDTALKALDDKLQRLRSRKVQQLGALVIASGADALAPEVLAGALLAAGQADVATKEAWRVDGERLFRRARAAGADQPVDRRQPSPGNGGGQPAAREDRA